MLSSICAGGGVAWRCNNGHVGNVAAPASSLCAMRCTIFCARSASSSEYIASCLVALGTGGVCR